MDWSTMITLALKYGPAVYAAAEKYGPTVAKLIAAVQPVVAEAVEAGGMKDDPIVKQVNGVLKDFSQPKLTKTKARAVEELWMARASGSSDR